MPEIDVQEGILSPAQLAEDRVDLSLMFHSSRPSREHEVWHTEVIQSIMREQATDRSEPRRGWTWYNAPRLQDDHTLKDHHKERAFTAAEVLFMCRSASRIEAELHTLSATNPTVAFCWRSAKRAKLSDTTAAELALLAVARECEDLRRQVIELSPKLALEPDYMI